MTDEIPTDAYVASLLKEIAARDKSIVGLDAVIESKDKYLKEARDERDKFKSLWNDHLKQEKDNPKDKIIRDLEQRLTEQVAVTKAHCMSSGALLRDADSRRKDLRLMKSRLEAMESSITAFLKEEVAIREAANP